MPLPLLIVFLLIVNIGPFLVPGYRDGTASYQKGVRVGMALLAFLVGLALLAH